MPHGGILFVAVGRVMDTLLKLSTSADIAGIRYCLESVLRASSIFLIVVEITLAILKS